MKIRKLIKSDFDLDGSFQENIKIMQEMLERYNDEGILLLIKDGDGESSWYDVYLEREETPEEIQAKIIKTEARKKQIEENEFQNFLKLKEKFRGRILEEKLDKIVEE